MFKALVVSKEGSAVSASVRDLDKSDLPTGNVTVSVEYSGINYKDGLVVTGGGGLVRQYPHVPGIDFAGKVMTSEHPGFAPGDAVVLTGWRVGESRWGGLAQTAVVDGDWLVPLPDGATTRQCMAVGTAGLTAMLAILALQQGGVSPESGDILVTGAAGGVGSMATTLLCQLGYRVVASTGRADATQYLTDLGAAAVFDRSTFADPATKPLESERWAGCIDSVGGNTLARVLAQTAYGGAVAAVGLAGGSKLQHTVIPFLLRGVKLLGIDSVMCPRAQRIVAWRQLLAVLPPDRLESMTQMVGLGSVANIAPRILQGQVRGRIVVDVNA